MRPVAVSRPDYEGVTEWQIDLCLQFEADDFSAAMRHCQEVWVVTKGDGIEIAGLKLRGPWQPPRPRRIPIA